jgi:hypothetical protein
MTPKEKAKELVEKYFDTCHKSSDLELSWKVCKRCALIAVDEMLENDGWSSSQYGWDVFKKYFIEVKKEIEKL